MRLLNSGNNSYLSDSGFPEATELCESFYGTLLATVIQNSKTYERTLTRAGDTIRCDGGGYLNNLKIADLFIFLLETNEVRQFVARAGDFREIIVYLVYIYDIKNRIRELEE